MKGKKKVVMSSGRCTAAADGNVTLHLTHVLSYYRDEKKVDVPDCMDVRASDT